MNDKSTTTDADGRQPSTVNEEAEAIRAAFMKALDFALDECPDEPLAFLRAWREGDTSEWPEFTA